VMCAMDPNKFNRTVFISDNLPFLKALDGESVDLVVIDPPFGKKQTFTGQLDTQLNDDEKRIEKELMAKWDIYDEATAYEAGVEYPDQTGSTANFRDIWNFRVHIYKDWLDELKDINAGAYALIQATRYTHGDSIAAYIAFMTERMLEVKRVLKRTGAVYLHCDHTANAYLRQMMDAIFGPRNFRNEIIWKRKKEKHNLARQRMGAMHDSILWYGMPQHKYNRVYKSYDSEYIDAHYKHKDENGVYATFPCTNDAGGNKIYDFRGVKRAWRFSPDNMKKLYAENRLVQATKSSPFRYKKYLHEAEGVPLDDLWDDILPVSGDESTGYPTQKPMALARRMIEMSSQPGDLVLDCFAGCAYVPLAAEADPKRRWLSCDMSPRAYTITRRQFHKMKHVQIRTEGELHPEDSVQVRMGAKRKITIRVRGPYDIPPPVSDGASGASIKARRKGLAKIVFKQRSLETPQQIWDAFVKEWGPMCWYCGAEQRPTRLALHLDHIESHNPDGSNNDCWNIALACPDCNSAKGAKLTPQATIERAFTDERIATAALRDEQLVKFETRRKWARERYNKLKQRQK